MKFKLTLFIFISLISLTASACVCGNDILTEQFKRASLVAKIKILKITPDTENAKYHDADIDILNLYKGQHIEKIKVMTDLKSSCRFLPVAGSTWLIFAGVGDNKLSFSYCGGTQIDRDFDLVKYPTAKEIFTASMNVKLDVLQFLKNNNITNTNPDNVKIYNLNLKSTKGIKNKNLFAVFKVQVNQDFSVAKIKTLKKFKRGKINRQVKKAINGNKFYGKPLKSPTDVIIVLYYYDRDGPGFVSFYDL